MTIIIKSIKFIFYISTVLFLINPVFATTTGIFESEGTSQHDYSAGATSGTGTLDMDVIKFQDPPTSYMVKRTKVKILAANWFGSTDNSHWYPVNYWVSGTKIGEGTVGYTKGGDGNYYCIAFFDDGFDITGYTGNTNVDITGVPAGIMKIAKVGTPSVDNNMVVFSRSDATYPLTGIAPGTHTSTMLYSTSNNYNYSQYPGQLIFNIDRDAFNKCRLIINNSDMEIVNESTVQDTVGTFYNGDTTNNTWTIDWYNDFGDYIQRVIDFTFEPQAEDTILWGADSYVVDDTGSYSWSLSDSNWENIFYSKKASIYRDETLVHEVSLPTQTGTFYYTFEEEGSFTVKLRHTSALLPHVTIDTDTILVTPIGESFISITNATVYINTPIEFQFSYGFTPQPISPGVWSSATSIEARKLINGDWVTVNRWFYPDLDNVTPNVLYTYTIGTTGAYSDSVLVSEGDYIFYLTDFNHGDVTSTNVYTVEYQPGAPTENITTTYLNITLGETYLINDQFAFNYGIDNTNFTTGTNYIEIYNYDYGITTQSALLSKQTWYKYGIIYPVGVYDPTESFYWGGIVALPGSNKMLIRHDDINGSAELVHDNFTLSEINTGGYGLKLSAYEACINEAVTIWVTLPSAANLTIYSPSGIEIITYNLNSSTTITYYFPVSGQYNLELIPSGSNSAENVATIFISDCADDGIIEPPSGEIDDMYLNMFNFMTLPIFWGMIIFVGFIGGLAMKTNRNGDHLVSGNGLAFIAFGLLNLLAFIGMLAPYTMYAIVSTWIFAGIFFGVGRYLARGE